MSDIEKLTLLIMTSVIVFSVIIVFLKDETL